MVFDVSGVTSHSAAKLDRSQSVDERGDRHLSSDPRSPMGPRVVKLIAKPLASQRPRIITFSGWTAGTDNSPVSSHYSAWAGTLVRSMAATVHSVTRSPKGHLRVQPTRQAVTGIL